MDEYKDRFNEIRRLIRFLIALILVFVLGVVANLYFGFEISTGWSVIAIGCSAISALVIALLSLTQTQSYRAQDLAKEKRKTNGEKRALRARLLIQLKAWIFRREFRNIEAELDLTLDGFKISGSTISTTAKALGSLSRHGFVSDSEQVLAQFEKIQLELDEFVRLFELDHVRKLSEFSSIWSNTHDDLDVSMLGDKVIEFMCLIESLWDNVQNISKNIVTPEAVLEFVNSEDDDFVEVYLERQMGFVRSFSKLYSNHYSLVAEAYRRIGDADVNSEIIDEELLRSVEKLLVTSALLKDPAALLMTQSRNRKIWSAVGDHLEGRHNSAASLSEKIDLEGAELKAKERKEKLDKLFEAQCAVESNIIEITDEIREKYRKKED